ncbi:hypothetical protein CQ046_02655 [Chryseobacterium sp. MYb7]|uniref:helix-turn-helix transcriptional regulator n=1 Tax=Chryseobacterium sp. MYb7 TaxID=1827290 RepID=UPI000D00AB9A|nr:hypothetical protein [Chryseobacterium sp. MYb7]PRB06093.1 hypothetical protein CQ046_02655 [Chryseobacterium sp. MYb7]
MNSTLFIGMIYFRKVFFLGIIFSFLEYKSQSKIHEIDSLQTEAFGRLLRNGDFKKIILQERKYLEVARKQNYKKGKIRGNINIAYALTVFKKNKTSLDFLEIAKKELDKDQDNNLLEYLYFVYGVNYNSLHMHSQAIRSFDVAFEYAQRIEDKKTREKRLYNIYDWKRNSFQVLGMMDSVYSNEKKCMQSPMPMLFITIANRHFQKQNIDSAEFFINKANDLLLVKEIPIEGKANVLRAFGKLNIKKKHYDKALSYLFNSLKITSKANLRKRNLESYELISEAYKGLNDKEKEQEFVLKYSQLRDSLRTEEETVTNIVIEKILDEELKKEKGNKYYFYYIIISILIMSIVAIYLIRDELKKREKLKDFLIDQKVQESQELRKKLSNVHDELIQLVKNADPSFMNRFRELYPEFCNNLTSKYNHLTLNDLRLCAFIKLNFSNKQIADYDHISLRTVESKKYRLRKKLELPKEIDFNKWILEH